MAYRQTSPMLPPEAWQIALIIGLLVGLATLFGSEWRLAVEKRRKR